MNLPSRQECEGWDQGQVVYFMCQNKMQECVATVNRLRINGHRLLNLSDSDMSKFSLIHQPQLQKIVQDIKKNDGSFLDKLKRLKSKPVPKVPARDYRENNWESEELSDPEYDNDTYEDPHEDGSYEPPPSHNVFTATPTASFPRGEYLDSCPNRPSRPPRKPLRPNKASKQLPPEPDHMESDEEDYINPDATNDDDNYIEPEEDPPTPPRMQGGSRAGIRHPTLTTPLPERPPSPDFYEVPDKEENSMSLPSRLTMQSSSLPPKPSPRLNVRQPRPSVQEPTGNDEYEVCDPDHSGSKDKPGGPPPLLPKPSPREKSPKPPLRPRPDFKPREFESQTLPMMQTDHRPPPKAFSLDMKRPNSVLEEHVNQGYSLRNIKNRMTSSGLKISSRLPLPPQIISPKPTDRGRVSPDNGSIDQDKDADICKKPWYASSCDRKTADDVLFHLNKDGAFMVRKSSGHDAQQPYTLVVFYKGRVYNIPIRFVPSTQQYALGRQKRGEEYFSSISHIIENHQKNPLVLIDTQSNAKDATKLCYPVKP